MTPRLATLAVALGASSFGCGAPESSVGSSSGRPAPAATRGQTATAAQPTPTAIHQKTPTPTAAPKSTSAKAAAKKDDPLFPRREPGGWKSLSPAERAAADKLGDDYVAFLGAGRTPRRAIAALAKSASSGGATAIIEPGGNAAVLYRRGLAPASEGLNIVVVSVDEPRIELKQRPVAKKDDLLMLETRVHGTLELRSWMVHPLALDVHLERRAGRPVHRNIGEAAGDPVFSIPDLLPHLSRGSQRRGREVTDAERLDAFAAISRRALVRELARRKLRPSDFEIAETALVPASPVRRVGVDRALVGGYGQSNRAFAFAAVHALATLSATPRRTAVVVVLGQTVDRSRGGTSAAYVPRALVQVISALAGAESSIHANAVALSRSDALVGARKSGKHNRGLMLDPTSADTLPPGFRRVTRVLEDAKVSFHIGSESSSRARDIATLDLNAISAGILTSGHGTPGELASVHDIYQGTRACSAWLSNTSR